MQEYAYLNGENLEVFYPYDAVKTETEHWTKVPTSSVICPRPCLVQ